MMEIPSLGPRVEDVDLARLALSFGLCAEDVVDLARLVPLLSRAEDVDLARLVGRFLAMLASSIDCFLSSLSSSAFLCALAFIAFS